VDVIKDRETWAEQYEQEVHKECLQTFGEQCIVRLVWTPEDLAAGRVARCTTCMGGSAASVPVTDVAAVDARLSTLYKQSGDSRCTLCYGTGFMGGFKPVLYVMHMLAVDDPDDRVRHRSGEQLMERPRSQFLWSPYLQAGDLVVRVRRWASDGITPIQEEGRYVMGTVETTHLRTSALVATEETLVVAQVATLYSLPAGHAFQDVPVVA
jgi:hypothetical protein